MENRNTSTENMYILNEPKICKRAGWGTRKGRKAVGKLRSELCI